MPTECTATSLAFQEVAGRTVVARFDGGALTSDGGAVLLREVERATGILGQFAACFRDDREPTRTKHSVAALVRQRVYGLALGYEDLNDHDALRRDPLFAVLAEAAEFPSMLAGKSTLNRLELSGATIAEAERYKKIAVDHAAVDRLLAAGIDLGPLMGVPIAVKDLFSVTGMPRSSAEIAVHLPVPFCPAVSRILSTIGVPSSSFLAKIVAEISIR